jgi:hypothetical protein
MTLLKSTLGKGTVNDLPLGRLYDRGMTIP